MFQTPLILAEDPEPDIWVLAAPLVWQDEISGKITVPEGFRTDLASIPRPFRNIPWLDPNGRSRRPAVLHDWLYAWQVRSKDFADNVLRDALRAEGANRWEAGVFYYAVHWFGEMAWHDDAGPVSAEDFATVEGYNLWRTTTLEGILATPPRRHP